MEKSLFPMFEISNQLELNKKEGERKDMQFKEIIEKNDRITKEMEIRLQKEIGIRQRREKKIRERREKERREKEGFCCECCMRNFGIGKYDSRCFPPIPYKGYSIVEGLNSIGVDSSFYFRSIIAEKNWINNYAGSPQQNSLMLYLLKNGKLLKP